MPVFNNVLAGAAGQSSGGGDTGYKIERSLRFDKAAQNYLSRTFSSGNRLTFTLSFWYKPAAEAGNTRREIFTALHSNGSHSVINFTGSDQFEMYHYHGSGTSFHIQSQAKFIDVSAWQHFVIAYDTTIASPSTDRIKVWCNGIRIENWGTASFPSQNFEAMWNDGNVPHRIGNEGGNYLSGYLAEMHYVEGSAKAETDFGEFDSVTGEWNPIEYTGSHNVGNGVNGFYLDFSDASSNSALGNDAAGNNNWSVTGLIAQGSAGDAFTVLGNQTNSGNSNSVNVSSLSTISGTPATSWAGDSNTYNNMTVDFGTVGTYNVHANPFLSSSNADIYVYKSNDGSTWTALTKGQDPYNFTGRYIQWARTSSGYGAQNFRSPSTFKDTDSLFDSPTSYQTSTGNNRGNYATWNRLDNQSSVVLSNGNLDASHTVSGHDACRATFKFPETGKWYYEATIVTLGNAVCIGLDTSGAANPKLAVSGANFILVNSSNSVQRYLGSSLTDFSSAYSNPMVDGILQVAYDADADKLWFGMNNVWMGSGSSANGNPSAGTEPSASNIASGFPVCDLENQSALSVNFGARPWAFTPPSGFKGLCSRDLDDPLIDNGANYFDILKYQGNGAGTVGGSGSTQDFSNFAFAPGMVWIKDLEASNHNHNIADIDRRASCRERV